MQASLRNFQMLLRLGLDGLIRKKGRSALTALGVFVGVFALTMIVALGEGLSGLLDSTVSGEENLRQIGISGGRGDEVGKEIAGIKIEGEMPEPRRERLRRAAIARTRPGPMVGRRAQALSRKYLEGLTAIPHVESVEPLILERYRVEAEGHAAPASLVLGLNRGAARFRERMITGQYFSSDDAPEVLVHEYLAYTWGYRTDAELATLTGKQVSMTVLTGSDGAGFGGAGSFAQEVLSRADFSVLSESEAAALPGILLKIPQMMGAMADGPTITRTFRVAGVVRDRTAADPFNVLEDGNTFQVDFFLPPRTAEEFFLASPVNAELGFPRALVTVDDSANATAVEEALRAKGLSAFSVAGVVSQVSGVLVAVTVIVAFLTGIALVVAAFGILNTMVTSVLERTREIGLWKAVGATDTQVRIVFMLEAGIIGLIGGLAGLGLALVAMLPGEALAQQFIADNSAFPINGDVFRVPLWLLLTGPGVAVGVGVLAALYPAWRASRVDPVRALRHE